MIPRSWCIDNSGERLPYWCGWCDGEGQYCTTECQRQAAINLIKEHPEVARHRIKPEFLRVERDGLRPIYYIGGLRIEGELFQPDDGWQPPLEFNY